MTLSRREALIAGLVLVALFLGSWVISIFPASASVTDQPFERHAGVGQAVDMRTAVVTVVGVAVADEVVDYQKKPVTSAGKFLVVSFHITAKDKAFSVPPGSLIDEQGRRFGGSQPLSSLCGTAQPALPRACASVFELPQDALSGTLTFRLPASTFESGDDVAVISLGTPPSAQPSYTIASGRLLRPGEEK